MKINKILFVIFFVYISAYSRDILQYHTPMNDRNINITLESISVNTNKITIDANSQYNLNKELDKVRKFIDDGNFFNAVNLCNSIETNYMNYYEIYYLRGLSYFRRADLYYASLDFNKILSLYVDEENQDKVYRLIFDFFNTINEYEETLKVCITAYKMTDNPYWLFLAGNSSLKNADVKSADYYFKECLKKDISYANEGFGDLNLLNKQYDEALNSYKKVRYVNNDDKIRIQSKISNASVKREIEIWNKSFQQKDYNNAMSILQNISSYSLDYPEITVATAKTYFALEDYNNSKNILIKFIESVKDFDEAYAILAQIYLYEKNETEAIKILEKGLEYTYNKPRLYETFASMLYNAGYIYYPDKIISQIINLYNISDENKIDYSKSLIRQKKYDEASKLLKSAELYKDEVSKLLNSIECNKILDKAAEFNQKNYYVNLMQMLSRYRFDGNEEQIRIGYIADAYYNLGSIDKAIDILKEAFNADIISINNVFLLRRLLNIRASDNDTSAYQKERDAIDITATEYWEEELKLHLNLVTDRIFEFMKFNQFDEALSYISELRNKNYDVAYIKQIESTVYGLYSAYLYKNKKYEEAYKTVSLAFERNRNNYDAIAIKNEMDVNSYLSSIGYYDNINAYISLSSTMKEILRISPAYIENRIKLAEAYIREYNLEGFNIINNITDYININGGKDLLLGRGYNKAYLYDYSISCYDRASKYITVNPIYIAENYINLENNNISSDEISKLLNKNINNADTLYAVSKLYTKIGNYNNAMNTINNALSIDDSNLNYLYQRGSINEIMGNTKSALNDYEKVLKINKNYAAANYKLAEIYLNNLKNDMNAETYALNYLALIPDDYSGYELLGRIYKARAEKYIDKNTKTLLKEALSNYEAALNKAVWGKDFNARKMIAEEIEYLQNEILEYK
ncbi:tetratricopeptide repeat protein [uncultured Brachyspira sp.]|uniref:tetratricopeptide repeat protein n=2 Tax=uncultured Brachyspira sp. TaxID=221953 RepID=UPI0025DEB982|nr:tetratricopeptide repeat protein [uncultured Brachyspira sp.]